MQHYAEMRHDDPKWLRLAFSEIGVSEIKGDEHSDRVLQYHATTTLGATNDETPWCSSFTCFVMQDAGLQSTRSAASLSWMRWGKRLSKPTRGCIVVFERADSQGKIIPNRGHVGFWLGETDDTVYVLGGNQSNKVGINRYRRDMVVSYRWPMSVTNSTTNVASTSAIVGVMGAAAPTVTDIVNKIVESKDHVARVTDTANEIAHTTGLPMSDIVSLGGMCLVVAAAVYIIKERNKKIRTLGV